MLADQTLVKGAPPLHVLVRFKHLELAMECASEVCEQIQISALLEMETEKLVAGLMTTGARVC